MYVIKHKKDMAPSTCLMDQNKFYITYMYIVYILYTIDIIYTLHNNIRKKNVYIVQWMVM